MRVWFAVFLAVLVAALSFTAETQAAIDYNAEDWAVLQSIKSNTPGIWPDLDFDNPNAEDYVFQGEDDELAGMFPPSRVWEGDTLKFWWLTSAGEDGSFLIWMKTSNTNGWRVLGLCIQGSGVTSFDTSKLTDLPRLSMLAFDKDVGLTRIELSEALQELYSVEIEGNKVEEVDVSKLTGLTAFRLSHTKVRSLALPQSSNLSYFLCSDNQMLEELSGFYDKETALKPFSWYGNTDIFMANPLLEQHSITITPPANGTITKNGGEKIYNGDSVTFTVKVNAGYKVKTFQINGAPVTLTGETYTHKATGDVTASATLVQDTEPVNPPDDDDTPPADDDDNTIVAINNPNSNGKIVSISVETNTGPIPADVTFKIWLLPKNTQSQNLSAKAASDYIGPFVVESKEGTLDIDVDNLKYLDGTKGSIDAGTYTVKFADAETEKQYVGTIRDVDLKATEQTNDNDDTNSGGGSGGCNAGVGMFALLLAGLAVLKNRKA
jgi:hypothetical protein